jgi:hypothetical protein
MSLVNDVAKISTRIYKAPGLLDSASDVGASTGEVVWLTRLAMLLGSIKPYLKRSWLIEAHES